MKKRRLLNIVGMVVTFGLATVVASNAQTFKSLFTFNETDGANPFSPLVEGTDGSFYGTTCCGGTNSWGTVFKIDRAGQLTTIYNFCAQTNCTDGSDPYSPGLVLNSDGNFYGTTSSGGASGSGTIFKITPAGVLTTLYSFTGGADGNIPQGLTLGSDGFFYGTTEDGANVCYGYGCGTVFRMTPSGHLTTLYRFCPQTNCPDGGQPPAGVVQGSDGNFYGTTSSGGANGVGAVFKITPTGAFTTLYSFCSQTNCVDGSRPQAGLALGNDGNLYGTTSFGGFTGFGTVFEITTSGVLSTVHSFCVTRGCPDGYYIYNAVTQGSDGNIYGATQYGKGSALGQIFRITPAGTLNVLYGFCLQTNCADGAYPNTLLQATDGRFYGTTSMGGLPNSACNLNNCGTVFGLSVGLAPFVRAIPNLSSVGRSVGILGDNLTGATSVTFNGIPATFQVLSRSLIKATVPAGATTGTITVTTSSGTLSSNVPFRVLP